MSTDFAPLSVLIVDDEAPARDRLRDLLGDIADTQPTRIAGMAASGVEALAVLERQPVDLVLTDIRGCRQVVDHDVNGLLVPPGQVEPLADAVARLAGDEALRARLGDASVRKAAAEFDQQRVIDRTLATYRRLLEARGLHAPVPR